MYKSFDFQKSSMVKGIALIFLLFHHLFFWGDNSINELVNLNVNPSPLSYYYLYKIAESLKICVGIFIFISAYGITRKSMNYSLAYNLKDSFRRYIKLYSNYFFIFLIIMLIGFISSNNHFQVWDNNIMYFIYDLLGLSYVFGTPTYNYTWWYMSLAFF